MKRFAKTLLVAAATIVVASPAFAWTCHAKNARGANYYGVAVFRAVAMERALAKCRADSLAPGSCYIVICNIP